MSAWAQMKESLELMFNGFQKEQRKAIVMSLVAKRQGLDLDKYLNMDYEELTKELKSEMKIRNSG